MRQSLVLRKEQGLSRLLMEVEVTGEVAEDLSVLPDVRPAVGAAVGLRVEPLAVDEVVLDELEVRVEAEGLVVDEPAPRKRADHESRHAKPVPAVIDARRLNMVVEPAPVVPGEEDRGRLPLRAPHERVDEAGYVVLAGLDV